MSPLWREQLLIGLAPDAVEYAFNVPRGRRPRTVNQGVAYAGAPGPEPWRGAVTALAGVLPAMAARKPTCDVLLSSHFVRYQLLPWNDNINGLNEYASLARAQFIAVHGPVAEGWDIRLGRAQFGSPVLACAVDMALLNQIDGIMEAAGAQVSTIQPYFSAAFDRWRSACKSPAWWFVAIEPGRLSIGRVAEGVWQSVSSRLLGANPVDETLAALDQEITLSSAAPKKAEPVHAVAAGLRRDEILALRDAGFKMLGSVSARHFDLNDGIMAAA